ncbi:MAG: Mov34/MPN/PAD-1 family protein [Chloroflexi bacterium]|nr:Mov34/MPN/PAD-1 family protein [Chloroflexota bacterium]
MKQFGPSVDHLIFARPNGGRVQIGAAPLAALVAHIQDEPAKPEAGGVLLGRHIRDSNDIVVDGVTTPMAGDRRTRRRFRRGKKRHQAAIDEAWRVSNGTSTYLGEWHSHPEPLPTPSLIDRLDWGRKILFDRHADPIFFVIVGISEIRVWEGRRNGIPTQLPHLTEDEAAL